MSEFEKSVLTDVSKMIRLQADRAVPRDSIWVKLENAAVMAVVTFLATWWIATIIRL